MPNTQSDSELRDLYYAANSIEFDGWKEDAEKLLSQERTKAADIGAVEALDMYQKDLKGWDIQAYLDDGVEAYSALIHVADGSRKYVNEQLALQPNNTDEAIERIKASTEKIKAAIQEAKPIVDKFEARIKPNNTSGGGDEN